LAKSFDIRRAEARFGGGVFDGTAVVMNTTWIKHGLTRIGVWCALVGVTVLLTVLFSFLGNLTCAVLSGMILGAARRWRWNAIPISLVFPTVILTLSHYSKLELPPEKVHLIALVCGAAFWGVYGMTFGLYFLEKKEEVPPGVAPETAANTVPEFRLAALRGSWTCEDPVANGSTQCKTLRIEEGKFALTVSERGGRVREIARGEVSVDASRTDHVVVAFNEERDFPGRQ
jgi:hypothetical protein